MSNFFKDFGRKPSTSNPTTVILTRFMGNDYAFQRADHAPNFRQAEKRFATEEAALRELSTHLLNGDKIEFIDSKEKSIRTYTKGSNKLVIRKAGEEVTVTTNF